MYYGFIYLSGRKRAYKCSGKENNAPEATCPSLIFSYTIMYLITSCINIYINSKYKTFL